MNDFNTKNAKSNQTPLCKRSFALCSSLILVIVFLTSLFATIPPAQASELSGRPIKTSDSISRFPDSPVETIRKISERTTPLTTTVLFEEDFETEPCKLLVTTLTNWDVVVGSVDVIGEGSGCSHNFVPGNGKFLDMDGTSSPCADGTIQTKSTFTLTPGLYQLEFSLAGSRRGDVNTIEVRFGDGTLYNESFTLDSEFPQTTFTRTLSVASTTVGKITFDHVTPVQNCYGILLFSVKLEAMSSLLDFMTWNPDSACPLSDVSSADPTVGGPISPRNGNLSYSETDLRIPVSGCLLEFQRTYISEARSVYTDTLGSGWTHNYDMQLHLTNTEISGTVELQTPGGSRLPFFDNGDGTYTPYAGVTAELVEIGSTYVITGFNQKVYTFDANGLLLEKADPYGNVITFTYNTSDQLIRAGQGDRFLTYAYDGSDRLETVTDNLNRTVTLGYDTNGDLTTVTDTLGLPTTYEYSGTTHLLTKVTDPSGTVLEETAYDNDGRAHLQWDGEGNLLVEIDYSLENTRVVTENGVVMTYTYDARNTLVGIQYACTDGTAGCQADSSIGYDGNFKQDDVMDLNGNPTTLDWNAGGSNLEYVQDALGNETFLSYDQFNNLTQTTDARDNPTSYFYDNSSFPTFLTKMTDALSNSTYFTPTTAVDGVAGLLKQQEDADGRITTYAYNGFGQITETVRAAGTSDAVTTSYGYDAVGRLTTTTQSSVGESITNLNVYDNGDRLIATIGNWDNVLDWQNCSFASGVRETNICTLYDYDDAGRIISMTNALGQTNLTFYDDAGRTFLNVSNWDGSSYNANDPLPDLCDFNNPDPEFNLCSQTEYDAFGRVFRTTDSIGRQSVTEYDSLGRVSRSVSNWQDGVFNANDPDGDIEIVYEYDANGNTLIVTDTVGRMTRTFYDALNRVDGTISNWDGSSTLADCANLPAMRDSNICTQYEYDEVGNTIIVTDTLGRMSRTFYDELNRVEATVQNWQPSLTSPDNCVLSSTNDALENICTLYGYDDSGNQITTTNALNQTSLTVYDMANRPYLSVQNWDGTPITGEADCSFPPTDSDTNVCSVTYYDALGRRSGSKDSMGNLTDYDYDGLGRLITTTRYLDGVPIETSTEYDALGNRLTQTDAEDNETVFVYDSLNRMETSTSAEGVVTTQIYNAAGWVTQTLNGLSHPTTITHDDFGRRLTVTDAETNVTEYEYDALGNQTAMIDAELVRTTYVYDDLNRMTQVIENDVPGDNPTNESDVITEYSYDALGNRVHITNALSITNTYTVYDVLNRPSIVEDALGNQTETLYNALGYRTVMTDGNGAVTTYFYDGLNRLETINYLADGETVQYSYDALGNRTVMTDDLGTTSYTYDDLYRLVEVTDPFTATIGYDYDKVGNRTNLIYPDSRVVTYTYDMDNRLETVLDWDSGTTTYDYDEAGRLITTTLPNGVVSVNIFDDANRLTNLSHTSNNDVLIASFAYELDGQGNRTVVTETIRQPGELAGVTAFLEENGQLVLEAESGATTAGTSHSWNSQTTQSDYAGTAYLRALPDIGQQYDATATADSPGLNFTVQIDNPGTYTVWARGMAPDAGGDSLHIGLNDNTPTTAANLTVFAPNEWTWSRLTMSNTNATVDLNSSGTYTLNVWMREDGLRLDKLMLVTDTATIPTGQGPLESPTTTALPNLTSHTIQYVYDPLYRLTNATYTGDITATYSYVYDAVGNMSAYTETVGTESSTVNRTFDDANQLLVSTDTELGTTSFYYDGNGNLVQILPPGVSLGEAGEQLYTFDQRNLLTQYEVGVGGSVYDTIAEYRYDGGSNRLQQIDNSGATPITTTYTNDNSGLSQVVVSDDGTTTTYNLFGLDLIQQDDGSNTRTLLVDGLGSARVEMVGNTIETATTYEPYGKLLAQSGSSGTVYGYTGEQYDAAISLVYLRARSYNPNLKVFMSRDPFPGWIGLPASQHPYSYVHNNPLNFTDPTGEFLVESSVVVVGGTIIVVAGIIIIVNNLLHNRPALDVSGFYLPPVPKEWEKLYVGDDIWAACTTAVQTITQNLPKTDPERQDDDPPPPPIDGNSSHKFYYVDISDRYQSMGYIYEDGYSYNGRRGSIIAAELDAYSHIPGVGQLQDPAKGGEPSGMINQVLLWEQMYLDGNTWTGPIMMGRKFEAERALWFANKGALIDVTAGTANPQRDLHVNNFGSIQYIEVKWGESGISSSEALKVTNQARAFQQGTFLLEANMIGALEESILIRGGGEALPADIPYP